ncbi:hypothetical protein BC831DRAFT_444044 [Entophlyctis helioformis]|nr:hypothetical protein BC831DRAFT_444044 [Entophlyctis helioformis]
MGQLVNGPCMVCQTVLAFPETVQCFQCAVCQTVNDLIVVQDASATTAVTAGIARLSPEWVQQRLSAGDMATVSLFVSRSFANPDAVCASYRNDNLPLTPYHSGVSINDIRQIFVLLFKVPAMEKVVLDSLEALLKRPGRPIRSLHDALFLHVALEIPDLISTANSSTGQSQRNMLLARLFGLVSSLEVSIYNSMMEWFGRLPLPIFKRRIEVANMFITFQLSRSEQARENYPRDWGIRSAARFLSMFFLKNAQRTDRLSLSLFYNTVVDYIDLIADFHRWQQSASASPRPFSICEYPFLISLGSKMLILDLDAREQMFSRFRDAVHRMVTSGIATDPFLSITVRRTHLIEDSLDQLQSKFGDLKKKLRISFSNEEGVDAGGLTKEWFLLLVRQLFDPQYGMFVFDEDSRLCWFNVSSFENVAQFQLVGIIVGLSLYNTTILDVQLPLACFKKLLNVPVGLEDLKVLQPSLGRGLQQLLDYEADDVEEVFCRTFVAEYESFGSRTVVPLIPNGDTVAVTSLNKHDYVARYTDWILNTSISTLFEAFKQGFNQVCGGNALLLFQPEEIELMVRGSTLLDLEGLRLTSELDGFRQGEPVIEWFWQIVNGYSDDMKRQFLLFATGSDRIPATGTESLTLKISCLGQDCDRLPVAHTCFNQVCIYRYASKDKLKTKLSQAVQWSSGFLVK